MIMICASLLGHAVLVAAFFMVSIPPASGQVVEAQVFIGGYSRWQTLRAGPREGYVMGLLDEKTTVIRGDDGDSRAYNTGINNCVKDIRPSADMLVQQMNETYRGNPDLWNLSPVFIFDYVVVRVCERYFNDAGLSYSAHGTLESLRSLNRR
jgi:hypothetical protein